MIDTHRLEVARLRRVEAVSSALKQLYGGYRIDHQMVIHREPGHIRTNGDAKAIRVLEDTGLYRYKTV